MPETVVVMPKRVVDFFAVQHAISAKFWLSFHQVNDVAEGGLATAFTLNTHRSAPGLALQLLCVHAYSCSTSGMTRQNVLQIATAIVSASASDLSNIVNESLSAG
jgi:hypothetical protein